VHRKKTKLAARAHRLGTAIERRGIAATYELHDRLLSNRASRRKFAHGRPELDSVQRSIVDALGREGYASVPFTELVADETLRQQIEEQAHRFTTETEHALASDGEGLRRRAGKEFVVFRCAQETNDAKFDDEVIDDLLRLSFGQDSRLQIALEVDVQKS